MLSAILALVVMAAGEPPAETTPAGEEAHRELDAHIHNPQRATVIEEHERHHRDRDEVQQRREEQLDRALKHHIDPRSETPSGRMLVYCVGSSMDDARATELETALVAVAARHPQVKPVSGMLAKRDMPWLPLECRKAGQCMAVLARDLQTRYVLTCNDGEQPSTVNLRLWDLERAEVVDEVDAAVSGPALGAAVDRMLAAGRVVEAVAASPAPPRGPSRRVTHLPPPGRTFPSIDSTVPFWVSLGTTTVLLGASLYTTAQFGLRQNDYNRLATGRTVSGRNLEALRGRVEHLATVGNVLWGISAGAALLTVTLAIFTDWTGGSTQVTPYVTADGGGASLLTAW